MENDEEQTKIEQLRQRYRREAHLAIEDAKQKTKLEIEEKYDEKIKILEEEIRKWKSIAEGLSEEPQLELENDPKAPLLKYIMEGVYREIKKEFSDGTEESHAATTRTKRALIVATEKLMSKLPKLTLRMENTEAKKKLIKAKHFRSSFQRAPCLTVHLALPSLPLIPYVTLTVDQRHSSGLFGKEYTVYKIATTMKITLLTHNKRDSDNQNDQTITFIQFRRYSDFVTLHSNLQKKFPRLVLPPLPPKLSAKSTAPISEKKQNESRRRWLCLWLQYVLLHGNFQKCDLLKEFVIPGEKSTEVTQFSNLWETGTFAETSIPLDFDEDEVPNRHSSVDSKTGIPPPPSIVDVINDAALFKSTQETHTVLRDCNQLKPNINFAMDACKGLLAALSDVVKAQRNFAQSFSGLIEAQDCQIEKDILREIQTGTEKSIPYLTDVVTALHNNVLEPLQFLEIDTMSIAASHISDIQKMTPKSGVKYFQCHNDTIADWNTFRQIRHDMLISSILSYSQFAMQQHKSVLRTWAQLIPKIKELDLDSSEFSSSVHRGWRGLVERERNEFAATVNLLNESHSRKREAQSLFSECNDILSKERKLPPTRSLLTGESKIPEPTEPSLRHRGLSRPTIPAGSRRDPTEKTFHQDAEEVAEAVDYNANSAYAHSSEARQYSEARPYLSEDVPTQQTRDATPGLSPQKKKKSWGSFFFGSKKSSSEQSPIKSSPSTTQSRAANETDHILEEEPEDTPMNRAYQERILREERRLEEEEDRHRLGGAQVSDRPDDVDEHLQEKRNRRRPPTTGVTNQRRPKPTSKPIITQPEQPLPQPTHPPVTTPQPALNPTPIQPEARASQREPPGHSSSYQNPSYLQNLTQQTISGQLNAAVRSRAKSDAPTSVPDLAPAAAAPLEKADPIIVEKLRPDSTPSTSIPSTSTPLPTPVESEPLPEGWEEVYTEDGIRYYYHKITRMSRWERPSAEVAAAVENRLNLSQKQIDESIERKRREREQRRIEEEQNSIAAEQLQSKIAKVIQEWKTIPGSKKERSFGEMLTLLPTLLGPQICPPGSITSTPLNVSSPPSDIKKAYMKAVRYVHPDKIPGDADLETKLLAEQVFICLSQLYDVYRKAHGL